MSKPIERDSKLVNRVGHFRRTGAIGSLWPRKAAVSPQMSDAIAPVPTEDGRQPHRVTTEVLRSHPASTTSPTSPTDGMLESFGGLGVQPG